ncbi:hypothetical protein [Falsiruegeria mediterranea]|uniref:Uncharacterized protein n=1 Tax=Falsiruegeria mediterranea M17 TaxID=1200281 RepID=A0A2R8C5K9_9RHOB|nr:hypothetical protein [Falsiruegeria mediterranea]SPJ27643.1 hypothetical protein TRM7615_01133 [Falsiruegeria mediterranea M17]
MADVTSLPLAHFELTFRSTEQDGVWFGLSFPQAQRPKDRGPLASGPVPDDLPAQLRAMADHIEGVQNERS